MKINKEGIAFRLFPQKVEQIGLEGVAHLADQDDHIIRVWVGAALKKSPVKR
jgi:hypothetical protein